MRSISAYLNSLFTLFADHEHRTCIIQVKISIIFILEFLVKSLTKITNIFRICDIFWRWHLNELILCLLELLFFVFYWYFLGLIRFFILYRFLLWISIILSSTFLEFLLDGFDYLRP